MDGWWARAAERGGGGQSLLFTHLAAYYVILTEFRVIRHLAVYDGTRRWRKWW